MAKALQVVVADAIALGGLGAFGYGLYRTFGVGVCCIVVGVIATGIGVMLDRNAR